MDNQNVTNNAPAKKMSAGKLISIISMGAAALGGLGFAFVYFIWPSLWSIITLIALPLLLTIYIPVIDLLPIGVISIVGFVMNWIAWLSIAIVVAALAVSFVNRFVISKNENKGMTLAALIVSGAVLALIFLVTLVDIILTALGLSMLFSVVIILYALAMLPIFMI